jgi:hypothetical protein
MSRRLGLSQPGVRAAFGAALLFGASTPLAKLLLQSVNPWVLAGLLYLGSGIGLTIYRLATRAPSVRLPWSEIHWRAGAILSGDACAWRCGLLGVSRGFEFPTKVVPFHATRKQAASSQVKGSHLAASGHADQPGGGYLGYVFKTQDLASLLSGHLPASAMNMQWGCVFSMGYTQ